MSDTDPTEPLRDGLDRELQAARPAGDIGHAKMRANLKERLFGAPSQPVQLGRFVILERLGQGGMGVVYSAYDPELDRRVALKLLRTERGQAGSRARERLLREAQALAQLSHPNVVPVHEIGVLDDQVFFVMEFVVGQTLRDWAEDRSWREVLGAYLQAGRGLAAAHAVDLVHRDFKPDNVQVGNDGRIRVLDFGLARARSGEDETAFRFIDSNQQISELDSTQDMNAPPDEDPQAPDEDPQAPDEDPQAPAERPPSHEAPSHRRLDTPLTATGAILGTPAYMSPEQFAGTRVGPASDQFSFCVSLYEGLYGQRPFAGDTVRELRDSVLAGQVRPPPRASRVPGWLFPTLCRGMAQDPDQRYPSMDALLADLGRDPARRRRRVLLALLIAALAGVSVYSFARSPAAVDVCGGADRELAGIWNSQRRAGLRAAFTGTGRAYAQRAWPRVAAGLDDYAGAWAAMHESACRAHQRGEQSGELLDRRMACLERRKIALDSAVSVLREVDADSLQHSVEVIQKLPALAYCGNTEALMAQVPPPEDAAMAQSVDALRRRLSRATALEGAGRYTDALALVRELVPAAKELGYRPLLAEVLLAEGRIVILSSTDRASAIEPLRRATALGLAAGMNDLAVEALARGIFAEATAAQRPGEVLRPVYIAEALLEQVPEPAFVHALLLNNTGVVHMARGQRDQARRAFERALEVKRSAPGPTPVELAVVQSNLALVTPDPDQRAAHLESAVNELERALGTAHPSTLEQRLSLAHYTFDPTRARAILETTCSMYQTYHPELGEPLAHCLYYLGFLDAELGDRARAAERFAAATERFSTGHQPWLRDLARGQALLYSGAPGDAIPVLDGAIQALAGAPDKWWIQKHLAAARLARGMSLRALDRPAQAMAALERAHATLASVIELSPDAQTRQRLARARVELAGALWDAADTRADPAGARARAAELVAQALAWHRDAGPGHQAQVSELEAWLAARGLGDEHAAGQPAGAE